MVFATEGTDILGGNGGGSSPKGNKEEEKSRKRELDRYIE
jgi:hypothetical protein